MRKAKFSARFSLSRLLVYTCRRANGKWVILKFTALSLHQFHLPIWSVLRLIIASIICGPSSQKVVPFFSSFDSQAQCECDTWIHSFQPLNTQATYHAMTLSIAFWVTHTVMYVNYTWPLPRLPIVKWTYQWVFFPYKL